MKRTRGKLITWFHFWTSIFVICFIILTGRYFYIQVTGEVQDVSLTEWAEEVRKMDAVIEAKRGSILDSNGNLLAFNRPVYRIYAILDEEFSKNAAEPLHVENIEKTSEQLATILDLDAKEIEERLTKGKEKGAFQVEFGKEGRELSEEVKDEIQNLELPGINFIKESKRYYPNNHFASHIIGFINEDEETGEMQGITGIESMFNKYLTGENGSIKYERDRFNKRLLQKDSIIEEAKDGSNIYLTLDQKIQTLVEDALSKADAHFEPEKMSVVVMDVKTGEILGLSNRPSIDLNNLDKVENWYNDAISAPTEPGSTMKIFTWAAAIDSGQYDPEETFLSGQYKVGNMSAINDHNRGQGWGHITYDEGFYRSSNVAASKLVWEKMGDDVFLDYLERFQLFEKTNIELPSEQVGKVTYNYPSDKIRTGFGQSSTVTAMQMMKAATAIANKGEMLQPTIIKKVVDPQSNETTQEAKRTVVGNPIKEETAEKVIELMDGVVSKDMGTGRKFQLDSYNVIGKTGTAQLPNEDGGGYSDGRLMYSFLGMAPKDDPQLMVYVSATNPELDDTETGSDVTAQLFKNIMENSLHYLNVEPDEKSVNDVKQKKVPKLEGLSKEEAEKALEGFTNVSFVGEEDKVKAVNFAAEHEVYENERIIVVMEKPTMPNIKGWSLRDVHQLAHLTGIEVETKGEGFVTKQSVKVGKKLKDDTPLKVTLKSNDKSKKKKKK